MEREVSDTGFWWRWVVANGLGELLGLGTVFATGALVGGRSGETGVEPGIAVVAILVIVLAAFEGAVVGLAQWTVLRLRLATVSWRSWVVATVAGAIVAWILGMIPSTLGAFGEEGSAPAAEPPLLLLMGFAVAIGAVAGAILAAAQWWVLRRHVERARIWLVANALAWAAAMPVIFWLVGETIGATRSAGAIAALVVGVGCAGCVVGAVHGAFLVRMLPAAPPLQPL